MDWTIINNALGLVVDLSIPFVAAAIIASIIVGVFQVATQISDEALGFAGKLAAVALTVVLLSAGLWSDLMDFTLRIWGGPDFYH